MCQIQTAFWSCGQLAEGRTVLCQSYQHTKGRYCDGFSSFSRPVQAPCPNCQAGRPHPPSQQMSAAVQVQRCATPTYSSSAANVCTAPRPKRCSPADVGNATAAKPGPSMIPPTGSAPPITVTPPEPEDNSAISTPVEGITTTTASESIWPPPTILEPPATTEATQKDLPTNLTEPAEPTAPSEAPAQALTELERAWRKLAPEPQPGAVPSRISSAGAIRKPSAAPVARMLPRGLAPRAKMVAEKPTIASSSSGTKAYVDPASLWRDLSGVGRAAGGDSMLDPALGGG